MAVQSGKICRCQCSVDPDIYAALKAGSPEFRLKFADRIYRHLFNGGALSAAQNVSRWNSRIAEIDRAIVAESARWGDAQAHLSRTGESLHPESWIGCRVRSGWRQITGRKSMLLPFSDFAARRFIRQSMRLPSISRAGNIRLHFNCRLAIPMLAVA